jgi:hypothetical protein
MATEHYFHYTNKQIKKYGYESLDAMIAEWTRRYQFYQAAIERCRMQGKKKSDTEVKELIMGLEATNITLKYMIYEKGLQAEEDLKKKESKKPQKK